MRYIILLLAFLFAGNTLSAQNNSVKGFLWYSPFVSGSYLGAASFGYTRDVSGFISYELNAGYYKTIDPGEGTANSRFSFTPGIRYYLGAGNSPNNGLWLSGYPVIGYSSHSSSSKSYSSFEYGLGAAIGFRIDISKNSKWFMDMGIGASYRFSDILNYEDKTVVDPNTGLYSVVEQAYDYPPSELWVPRMVIQIGYRF